MLRALVAACLGLLVLLGPAPAQGASPLDKRAVERLVARFLEARPWSRFEAWDPAVRAAFLEEAAALELPDDAFGTVRDLLARQARKAAPRWKEAMPTPYGEATWIAKGRGGPKAGFVVGLHGGGEGAGHAGEAAGNWPVPRHLCNYPQGVRLVSDTWNTVHGERFVLTLIDLAKARDQVDPDRVYVMGFSMGGTGSFHWGGRWPDLLAGAIPGHGVMMAEHVKQFRPEDVGVVQYGLVPNLRNLDMYLFTGEKDDHCEPGTFHRAWQMIQALREEDPTGYGGVTFTIYPGLGHAFGPGEPAKALEAILPKRRNAFPDTITWEYALAPYPLPDAKDRTTRLPQRGLYWLECLHPVDGMQVRATKRREGDDLVIELSCVGADPEDFAVLLNPTMRGDARRVRVRWEGHEIESVAPPSLAVMLDTYDWRLDTTLLFDRRIRLDGGP